MPSYARTMHFRLTARDNRAVGGGICSGSIDVTVAGNSGPFKVSYPDTTNINWYINDSATITWNVAGTNLAPVSCSNVMVLLSLDSGWTYPDTLVYSTPNTGSVSIKVPDTLTTAARIRINGIGNVFYDISNNNFTIKKVAAPIVWIDFTATIQNTYTSLLNWTLNEVNVVEYEIEKSSDGINFSVFGVVMSLTGNSNNQSYSFVDQAPFTGVNYYRIKVIMGDGTISYSTIISLIFDKTQWINFTASVQNTYASLLNWTINELNVDYYEVEQSPDSVNFTTIGTVKSLTGNGSDQSYSFVKQNPFLGINYYRIKVVRSDGTYFYSSIVSLNFNNIPTEWTVYPVPTAGNALNVLSNDNMSGVSILLYDAFGRLIYKSAYSQVSIGQILEVDTKALASGIYTLKIISNKGNFIRKILVSQ